MEIFSNNVKVFIVNIDQFHWHFFWDLNVNSLLHCLQGKNVTTEKKD